MNFRNKRIKLLIFLFIFWLILIFIAQYSRSINTTDKSKLSEYTGIIVPERGKIFDKNGKILSQYKKYYNLYVNDNISTSKLIYIKTKLHKILPKTQFSKESNTQHILVKRNLSENDITNLTNLLTQYPFLIIKVEFKKNKIKPIQLKRYIGTAKFNNNKWIGISGLEKKYNTTLSGKNGIYSVMVTPKGHWIKNTWHLKEKPVSGENIYLNNSKKYILNRLTR